MLALGKLEGNFPSHRQVLALRKGFASAWAALLREAFPTASAVADAYCVDSKTARDWWHGRTAPSGFAVALTFQSIPDLAARYLKVLGGWLIGHSALPV